MAGHAFVVRGDLTKLQCDHWLLPTDARLHMAHAFSTTASAELLERLQRMRSGDVPRPAGWGDQGVRVFPVPDWPETVPARPRPWLVNVGGHSAIGIDWYMEGLRQFVAAIAAQPGHVRVTSRSKPLLALPLVGTGEGGAAHITGDIVRALLSAVQQAVREHDLDVALVVNSRQAFAAAQNARRQHGKADPPAILADSWPDLAPALCRELVATAQLLASYATEGRLALFLGAGVSQGAGLPGWNDLLEDLAVDAGIDAPMLAALATLDNLDRASFIEARLKSHGTSLGEAVASRLQSDHVSLAHVLLANLPISEVVTTNYDCLFEAASAAADRPAAVLPYESVAGHPRWLLKMHGCITHPKDIVLTRAHFLRYRDTQAALAGIVQALLITRHMFFVGFSLSDPNFHQIMDAVRRATRREGHTIQTASVSALGTALLLRRADAGREGILRELWQADLNLVTVAAGVDAMASPDPRLLEIFLDYLLAESSRGTAPLLDAAYAGILTEDERQIRRLLERLLEEAPVELRRSPAWRPIAKLLAELGARQA